MNVQQKAIIKRALISRGVNVSGLTDQQLAAEYQNGTTQQAPAQAPAPRITPDLSNTGLPPVEMPAQPVEPRIMAQQPQATHAPSELLLLTLNMLQEQGYSFTITATSPSGKTNSIQVS